VRPDRRAHLERTVPAFELTPLLERLRKRLRQAAARLDESAVPGRSEPDAEKSRDKEK
jgi:hypothetical protein